MPTPGKGQRLSLTKGCLSKSTIIHEFIHAIGFDHEQNRPDRDDYVKINWDNIKSGRKSQFDIAKGSKTFGTPYDGFSVMHYTAYHFTKSKKAPWLPTIESIVCTIKAEFLLFEKFKH